MDLELYPKNNAPSIEGYGDGYIKISGSKIFDNVLLLPDNYINLGTELNKDNKSIISDNINIYMPELLIYGSLKGLGYETEMLSFLKTINIPLEIMQIGSSVRTWSVLIGDGRNVSAVIQTSE